jgi:hypothetical protein
MTKKKSAKPRKRSVGRPSREKQGLESTKQFTMWIEPTVVEKAKEQFGSLQNALKHAVGF